MNSPAAPFKPLRRITAPTLAILATLLRDGRSYGLRISNETGLAVATVYPALSRLLRAGWVTAVMEDRDSPDEPNDTGAPRKYYSLTEEGRAGAQAALLAHEERYARARRAAAIVAYARNLPG